MKTKLLLSAVALGGFLLSASADGLAAGSGDPGNDAGASAHMREHRSMGGGMMGMGGMMGSCPMMGAGMGLDPKTTLRMHGEMMRAMGDIMVKYSDQAGVAK